MNQLRDIITFGNHQIKLLPITAQKLAYGYTAAALKDNLVSFSVKEAIKEVADQLDEAGAFINTQNPLAGITEKIEKITPALSLLKVAAETTFMQMLEIRSIDYITFTIAVQIPVEDQKRKLGSISIDGVGFQIRVINERG